MSGYTPGPWEVEYDDGRHIIRMGDAITSRGCHDVENLIAYDHGLTPHEESEEEREQFKRAEANARLIAAAPDLLEAAKRGLTNLHARIDAADPSAVPVFDGLADLSAAIARATNTWEEWEMNDLTTPWFWDTPDGGGWVRYWKGAFLCPYGREDKLRESHPEAMADYPGSRRPTAAERRAWKSIDPRVEDEDE